MAISAGVAALISAGIGAATGTANVIAQNNLNRKTREWNEKMLRLQNEWNKDEWNATNAYNSAGAQVSRLQQAGLNPLSYGVDGVAAQPMESAEPLGWNPDSLDFGGMNSIGTSIANLPVIEKQLEVMEAQKKDLEASANKKQADTDYQLIINEIAEKTKDMEIEGKKLSNDLKSKQLEEIDENIKKIQQDIKESAAREQSEFVKQSLMESEKMLNHVNAVHVLAMLPYEQALTEAKTDHEKAMASLCYTQAAINNGLLSSGYPKLICDELQSRIDLNKEGLTKTELDNAGKELELDIRKGTPNDLAKWFEKHPWAKAAHPALAFLSGDVYKVGYWISESMGRILGPLLAIFGVGRAVGAAKSVTPITNPSNGQQMVNSYGVPLYSNNSQ